MRTSVNLPLPPSLCVFLHFEVACPFSFRRVQRIHFSPQEHRHRMDSNLKLRCMFWNHRLRSNLCTLLCISLQTLKTFLLWHRPPFYLLSQNGLQNTRLRVVRTTQYTHQYPLCVSNTYKPDNSRFLQLDLLLYRCNIQWSSWYRTEKKILVSSRISRYFQFTFPDIFNSHLQIFSIHLAAFHFSHFLLFLLQRLFHLKYQKHILLLHVYASQYDRMYLSLYPDQCLWDHWLYLFLLGQCLTVSWQTQFVDLFHSQYGLTAPNLFLYDHKHISQ